MSRQPDFRIGIALCHITIEVFDCPIVVTLLAQRLHQTGVVASVGRAASTVAYYLPRPWPTLPAAAGAEEVVIKLVVASGIGAIEYSWRSTLFGVRILPAHSMAIPIPSGMRSCPNGRRTFQAYHHRRVCLIREDVSAESILLPTKIVGVIKTTLHWLPVSVLGREDVGIRSHLCECQDCALVTDVGARNLIVRPFLLLLPTALTCDTLACSLDF